MLFISSSISVNMIGSVAKYDFQHPKNLEPRAVEIIWCKLYKYLTKLRKRTRVIQIVRMKMKYRQTSCIIRTLAGNKIVGHSDVAGASPGGATQTISSFPAKHLASMDWAKTTARRDEKQISLVFGATYIRGLTSSTNKNPAHAISTNVYAKHRSHHMLWRVHLQYINTYRQVSNIRHKIPTLKRFSYSLAAIFAESLEARC